MEEGFEGLCRGVRDGGVGLGLGIRGEGERYEGHRWVGCLRVIFSRRRRRTLLVLLGGFGDDGCCC